MCATSGAVLAGSLHFDTPACRAVHAEGAAMLLMHGTKTSRLRPKGCWSHAFTCRLALCTYTYLDCQFGHFALQVFVQMHRGIAGQQSSMGRQVSCAASFGARVLGGAL